MQQYPPKKKKKKSVAELYAVSRWKQGTLCLAYISLTPAFEYKIAVHKEGSFVWTWERERTKSCFWKEKKAEGGGGGYNVRNWTDDKYCEREKKRERDQLKRPNIESHHSTAAKLLTEKQLNPRGKWKWQTRIYHVDVSLISGVIYIYIASGL